ncbi:MAG: integration host factor subunit beta [Alphaproteobacteria bacterium]|nr:integration host factor subunit beta [Alphaproteobacteria bacterium]
MTRSELIARVASRMPNLTIRDIDHIVGVIFDKMIESLADGDRIEIRGFGAFSLHRRESRTAMNPKNKQKVSVPEKNIIHFKTGKELHDMLNEN